MDIKPSGDVLKALSALHTQQAAAKPRVAQPQQVDSARFKRAEAPVRPETRQQARFYRPGTLLDIYV